MVLSNKEWLDKMNEIISAIQNNGVDSQVIMDMLSNMWSSSVTYNVGDYVLYNNNIWKCLIQNSNIAPTDSSTWKSVKITNEISTLNSNFSDIGKSCCFQQSNTTNVTNAFCPVDIQNYNDDTDLYKADGGGVLITKPGTYVVQASFHILFAGGDSVTVRLVNSISELVNTQYGDTNEGNSKQFTISLSKIVRIQSGQERVLLKLLSNNGNSYIFDKNSTNMNRISITKIV